LGLSNTTWLWGVVGVVSFEAVVALGGPTAAAPAETFVDDLALVVDGVVPKARNFEIIWRE
jgi:hypothetical protein